MPEKSVVSFARSVSSVPMRFAVRVIEAIRARLEDEGFKVTHRTGPKHFKREYKLPFAMVGTMLIRKSLKSLTCWIHEAWGRLELLNREHSEEPTASGWTRARKKFSHTAFIELNADVVLKEFYAEPGMAKLWHGHRLLACDGSLARLPDSETLRKEFGVVETANQHGGCGIEYPQARISVLYDVLNRLVRGPG